MGFRPGVDLPIIDYTVKLPVPARAGTCFAMDRRGYDADPPYSHYVWMLLPTSDATAIFCRYDLSTNAVQIMPPPGQNAATVWGAGTAMVYDESMRRCWLFTPQSTLAGGLEWARFQYYNVVLNTWTARTVVGLGLVAQWAIDASMCHPCSAISNAWPVMAGGAVDNTILLNGHAGAIGAAGPSRLGSFDIGANAWAQLTGAGGARGGAPAVGSFIMCDPSYPNYFVSPRGGGSLAVDLYLYATNAWAAAVTVPGTDTMGQGLDYSQIRSRPGYLYMVDGVNIKEVELYAPIGGNPEFHPLPAGTFDGADGAAHVGNGMVMYENGGNRYYLWRKHGSDEVQRFRQIL